MKNTAMLETAERLLRHGRETLGTSEQAVLARLSLTHPVAKNASDDFDGELTLGQRLADKVAAFGGSWTFILIFAGVMVAWTTLNTVVLMSKSFDPYPFVFLNLLLSMIAAMQAPVLMMSQNRMANKDRQDAAHDYEVNLKAELEIMALHEKLDQLRTEHLATLISAQQEQLRLIQTLIRQQAG